MSQSGVAEIQVLAGAALFLPLLNDSIGNGQQPYIAVGGGAPNQMGFFFGDAAIRHGLAQAVGQYFGNAAEDVVFGR